ncbi:MAG: hypothetical protein OXT65_09065 [Alphaproteobacteria bacterium]|nr:hypothetical protein [Alphaproteobacteria bacterium]
MKTIAVGALALCLSVLPVMGCTSTVPDSPSVHVSMTEEVVPLQVARIDIQNVYKAHEQSPYVDHLMSPPPVAVIGEMLDRRLRAAGSERVLRVIIEDASVVSEKLPVTEGFWGYFSKEPEERFKGSAKVRFELADLHAPDIIIGHAEVSTNRNKSVMEGATLAERDRALEDLARDLSRDLASGLDGVVRETFSASTAARTGVTATPEW